MSEEIKGNDAVAADGAAFLAAYRRAETVLGAIAGVVAVGYGHKEIAGAFTDDVCIHVFVREKLAEDALSPEQRIPGIFEGYRTDVRTVAKAVPLSCNNRQRYATIRGGMTITAMPNGKAMDANTSLGTLGLVVRKRQNEGSDNWYILSNEHVLYANGVKRGDRVYQPYPPSTLLPEVGERHVAILGDRDYYASNGLQTTVVPDGPYPADGNAEPPARFVEKEFYVDCAIARIEIDSPCFDMICTKNRVAFDTTIIDWKVTSSPINEAPQAADNNTARIAGVRSIALDTTILTTSGFPNPLPDERKVFKVGGKTGKTMGVVRGVMSPVDGGITINQNVIEIQFAASVDHLLNDCNHPLFAEHGDSGSVVVDANDNIVGLLFAVREDNPDIVMASHILPVLDALQICIPNQRPLRKVMSYGCADAEDGSGTKPYAKGAVMERDPDIALFSGAAATVPFPPLPEESAHMDALHNAFGAAPTGRAMLDEFTGHSREIGYLVRHCRPVTLAWHRHHGPALLALVLTYLRGDRDSVPATIGDVPRSVLFARMYDVLDVHGSPMLRDALRRHRDALTAIADAETAEQCLERLRGAADAGIAA